MEACRKNETWAYTYLRGMLKERFYLFTISFAMRVFTSLAGEKGMSDLWLCLHMYERDFVHTHPKSPWIILAAVFLPRVQEDFCQLWRKTATNKCYPGPVTFTRNHLLLGHEPACVEKPAQKSVGEDGTEQEEESWPVRNAVAVECSMDLECFQSWIPWSRWRGEERIRRTTYPLTTACSITGQPQCSQHAPWFLL